MKPVNTKMLRRVRIVKEAGLLERPGAKSELARILGVTRQAVRYWVKLVENEESRGK